MAEKGGWEGLPHKNDRKKFGRDLLTIKSVVVSEIL